MIRRIANTSLAFWASVAGLGIVSAAAAHHPPLMERCQSVTFTGRVDRIEWGNPHVELFVQADGGENYRLIWLNVQHLRLAGVDRESFRVGDEVIVSAGTREDVVERPMLLSAITRIRDGWEWSQVPQGC